MKIEIITTQKITNGIPEKMEYDIKTGNWNYSISCLSRENVEDLIIKLQEALKIQEKNDR